MCPFPFHHIPYVLVIFNLLHASGPPPNFPTTSPDSLPSPLKIAKLNSSLSNTGLYQSCEVGIACCAEIVCPVVIRFMYGEWALVVRWRNWLCGAEGPGQFVRGALGRNRCRAPRCAARTLRSVLPMARVGSRSSLEQRIGGGRVSSWSGVAAYVH